MSVRAKDGGRVAVGDLAWANGAFDIYLEVNHGPILIEGNDMLSNMACWSATQGAAFVENRIRGGYRKGGDEARRTPVFKPHSVVPDSLDKYSCEHGAFVFVNNILGGNPRFKDEVQGQQQRFRPAHRPTPAEVGQQVIVDSTDQNVVEYETSTDKEKTKCLQH